MQEQRANDIIAIQEAIQQDPVYFVDEFTFDKPEDYQAEIMRAVFTHKVVTVRSCHDVGKSWISGKIALAFLSAYIDSYVITTAPTFRQVENILWRGIRGTYNKARRPIGGKIYQSPRLDFGEEWFAIGLSTKDPDSFQGFHAPSGHMLVIVDEAAGVPEDIYVAIDSVLSSEGARLLMIGNPTSIIGRFHDSHHKDPSAKRFHLSCFDTPNFINNGIRNLDDLHNVDLTKVDITHPHLITPDWAKDKIRKWGVNSPMFQARVLGNFPTAETNTLIPLNLIEMAATEERREELLASYKGVEQQHFVGVDVARYGDDKTVITERWGGIVEPQIVHGKEDTAQTAGRVKQLKPASSIFVDTDGVGGGVADILNDDKFDNIVEVHGSASAFETDDSIEFVNLRAQMYWNLAEAFKTGRISIPEDDELMSQLSSIRFKVTRRGIQIESKDEIKSPKRLGISPDKADSLAYCFADFMEYDSSATPTLGKTYDDMYNESIKD